MSSAVVDRAAAPEDPAEPARRPRFKKKRVYTRRQVIVIGIINLATFFTLWQVIAVTFDVPTLFLPPLSDVFGAMREMYDEGVLVDNLLISASVFGIGMVISIVIAVPAGLAIGGIKILDRTLSPYVWALYTTPRLILMPLILLWVGINDTARIVIIVLSAVPATLVVVMEGVKTVDASLLKAARSFGAGKLALFWNVVLPSTIPFVATGIRMGISRGLIGLFIGELFTANNGIGYILALASKTFDSARTFAILLIFVMFCVTVVGLSQLLERRVSRWRTG